MSRGVATVGTVLVLAILLLWVAGQPPSRGA